MTRDELTLNILKLGENNNNIILSWPTGLGKSFGSLHLAKFWQSKSILLVVAETAHKQNWSNEINKFNTMYNYNLIDQSNVLTICYASLHKYIGNYDLVIFDEAHHLFTDKRIEAIEQYKFKNVILLSATLSVGQRYHARDIFGEFAISNVSLQDVIDNDILPTPKIKLIPLTLDNTKYDEEFIQEWGEAKKRLKIECYYTDRWKYIKNKKAYPNVHLIVKCTKRQKYNYISEQFEYYKKLYFQRRQEFIKNKWLQLGSQRKRFLGENKTIYVKKLLEEVKNKRFICFCSSIEQAKLLGQDNAIHSERRDSLDIINDFNNKKINSLFAIGMVQEGQNLNDIEVGIITQLDGSERPFIQKLGRVLRAKDPVQYIFYFKNTRDEEYLNDVLENIDKNMIEVYEIHS